MPHNLRIHAASVTALLLTACSAGGSSSTVAPTPSSSVPPTSVGVPDTTAADSASTSTSTSTMPTMSTIVDEAVVIEVTVEGGQLVSDRRAEVKLGDNVRLVIESDAADELHVHGYDLTADVVVGQETELSFVAEIPGIFEVEFETIRLQVLELVVNQ